MVAGHRRRRHGEVAADLLFEAVAGEGLAAGQALVEHAGQRIDVGTRVRLCGGDAFGCHVGPGADHARGVRQRGLTGGAGDAEVDQIREVVLGHQDVGRFDVAVHQPDPVSGVQRGRDLVDDPDGSGRVQRSIGEDALQVATIDQPHGHVELSVDLTEVMDRHDVRLVERSCRSGLAPEPFLVGGIVGELRGQHLQCQRPVRWRCRRLATPRPCRRDRPSRSADSGQTAFPPPGSSTQRFS